MPGKQRGLKMISLSFVIGWTTLFVVAFLMYYTLRNLHSLHSGYKHLLRITGIFMILWSELVYIVFPSTEYSIQNLNISFILFLTGTILLAIEFVYYWHNIKNRLRDFNNIEILRLFKFEWLRIAGLCTLIIFSVPLLTLHIFLGSHFSLYARIFALIGLVLLGVGERQIHRVVHSKIPKRRVDKKRMALLREDILMQNVCMDMINYYIYQLGPLGVENALEEILLEYARDYPVFSGTFTIGDDCKLYKTITPIKNGLTTNKRAEGILNTSMEVCKDIMKLHGDMVSTYAARYTLENIFKFIRQEYGNPSIFIDILLALPEGVLEEEKLSALSKELLETRVQQRTSHLSQAFLRAKEATEEKIAVVNAIIDPLVVIGTDGVVKTVNPAFESVFGYAQETIVNWKIWGNQWADDMDQDSRETLNNTINEAFKLGKAGPLELLLPRKTGKTIPVTLTASAIPYYDGRSDLILLFRDISKLKKREKELKVLDIAIESSINAVCIINTEKDILYVNQAFMDMFLFDDTEAALKTSLNTLITKDDNQNDNLPEILFDKRSWMGEIRCKRKDDEMFDAFMVSTLFEDEENDPMACMVSLLDISDRKAAEDWKDFLHSLLIHDVGNKLQIIQGYIELMLEEGLDGEMEEMARKQLETVTGTSRLINRVRMLRAVESESGAGSTNPYFILQDVITAYKRKAYESGIDLIVDYTDGDTKVRSDSQGGTLIESIFSNLMDNAIKHSQCSKIKITSHEHADLVVITIEDDGIGIKKEVIEKLTEEKIPKDMHKNLGLRLIKISLKKIGGHIDIFESELGGTRFDVYLVKRESEP